MLESRIGAPAGAASQVDFRATEVENGYACSWVEEASDVPGPQLVVGVRGTRPRDLRDLLDDLNVRHAAVPWAPSSSVHRGFLKHFYKLQTPLLARCLQAGLPVLLTGHSLGGAVALIAASQILALSKDAPWKVPPLRELFLFGAPKVGDLGFATWISEAGLRATSLRHAGDPIPSLPPTNVENACSTDLELHRRGAPSVSQAHSMGNYAESCLRGVCLTTEASKRLAERGK
jgi:hypothetical protein